MVAVMVALSGTASSADTASNLKFLIGTWTLVTADVLRTDGTQAHDYGESPKGTMLIDAKGRYSIQIFKSERPNFAAGDKSKGTPAEYEAAVMGSSTHFGTISVDAANHVLIFSIEGSSYKNLEGTQQKRPYELQGDELTWRVPPRNDGSIPITTWKRVK